MNLKKKEKILLGVLGVVILFFLFDMFVLSDDKSGESKKLSRIERKADKTQIETSGFDKDELFSFKSKKDRVSYDATLDPKLLSRWKRDPFIGAFTTDLLDSLQHREKNEFVLKAISWRGNIAYVIINDDVYREGESKNGIHVVNVYKDHVIITNDGKRSILRFGE